MARIRTITQEEGAKLLRQSRQRRGSDLEGRFLEQWRRAWPGLIPVRDHRFHPSRKWAFDFAWPDQRVAVEIEGGTLVKGRHTRAVGYEADCEKYNAAVTLGWRVFRYTGRQITKNWDQVAFQLFVALRGATEWPGQ